ncbi:hypothetical protein M0R45_029606 [Rubus argutus]|uniref:Uncharacterized protein n=1 Tax=Rubus argutus TaxID=59490 RepID=A0AAW1WCV3_RUBAR
MLVPRPRVYLSAYLCAEEVVLGAEFMEAGGLALEQILEQIQVVKDPEMHFGLGIAAVGDSKGEAKTRIWKRCRHRSSGLDLVSLFALFFLFYLLRVIVSTSTATT